MFSIENLLSSKYTPKSLQGCRENDRESVKTAKKSLAEEESRRNENATEIEKESQLGRRETAYVKATELSRDGESEGEEEKVATGPSQEVRRGRKRPSDGDSGRESCSCDEGKKEWKSLYY